MTFLYDVTPLMIDDAMDAAGDDDFSRGDVNPRRVLLFDAVMEGREPASQCLLLSLPSEVLACIVDLLADDKTTLASLALVNSDCRQLARSCQFADLHLDYSGSANQLIEALGAEAAARDSLPLKPSIGVCVRNITVASAPDNVASHYYKLWESIWGAQRKFFSREERYALRREASDDYLRLRGLLVEAIKNAMPNLEVLVWEDLVALDKSFFETVSRSPIKDLKLDRVLIDEAWRMEPPLTPAVWPLRSLDIEASVFCGTGSRQDTTEFYQTLLHRCAPTLESLRVVSATSKPSLEEHTVSQITELPSFPRLRHLRLPHGPLKRDPFSRFFTAPLRSLELSASISVGLGSCLGACQPFRDLESLNFRGLPEEKEDAWCVAAFLKEHNRIQKLRIRGDERLGAGTEHLEKCVIPTLADGGFHNLTCLSLAWGGGGRPWPSSVQLTDNAMSVIGTITSLERLSLSAGMAVGSCHQWLVDHEKLRYYLSDLKKLKVLALVRDTYAISCLPFMDAGKYYECRAAGPLELSIASERPDLDRIDEGVEYVSPMVRLWERAHRNLMLRQAEKYAFVFPDLEWILCGQWPMAFQDNPESSAAPRQAFPLTRERDLSLSFLERTFGLGTGDSDPK
ncbi:unnamed protein product [Clonostachys rosea]|uniref:F-box domain-containing protein n=1 Tax=Bionectria ochroleuca TaxID=29856 RepID=A0ABY6TZS2_BIOOC|nr:unnamed protein product [Clonostachys rosea]